VQAQILHQLNNLRHDQGTAILLITHDFGVVAQMADDVSVLYGGRIVETGDVEEMHDRPYHPYTHALLATLPRLHETRTQLHAIPGQPPELAAAPEHCPFIPRCQKALTVCKESPAPELETTHESHHRVACYNPIWQEQPV
jgi:oligopeptide/dipeptide ABC transporter ATP-binding protein